MVNIYIILCIPYIFCIGSLYLYKSQKRKNQYKPVILFLTTMFTSIIDIISCILYETNNFHFKLINFVLSHLFTSLILSLTTYRFFSFYLNDIRFKNMINNISNKKINNKYRIFIILLFTYLISSLVYSVLIIIKYKHDEFNKTNWQYYPIYIQSISFFLIVMPIIIYLLKGIYNNIYECYLKLSMGFLGCFMTIIFDIINIKFETRYILLFSNFLIINILYMIPLYYFYKYNKKTNKQENKNIDININLNEIYCQEMKFLKNYQNLKKCISNIFNKKLDDIDNINTDIYDIFKTNNLLEKNNKINIIYFNFYNENIIELKEKYDISLIENNIKNDIIPINIFDHLKNNILKDVYCNLYKSF